MLYPDIHMQAIQILTTGSADVLTLRDLPTPTPAPGEALIRIEASGVNFIDTYFREGRYPAKLPYTLGQEAAGTVVAVASDVTAFKPGDRVAWCGVPGTYAQLAVAPASRLVPIPDGITSQQVAAALTQGITAHYLTHSTYPIQRGDEVLIHAGAGGTGLLFIQMAKALGARVFTTVSTEEKAALARARDGPRLLFRHVLDGDRVGSRVACQAERGNTVVKAVADIVKGVNDLEGTLGQRAGILDGNQNAVEDATGGQGPAAKINALAASGQKNESETG